LPQIRCGYFGVVEPDVLPEGVLPDEVLPVDELLLDGGVLLLDDDGGVLLLDEGLLLLDDGLLDDVLPDGLLDAMLPDELLLGVDDVSLDDDEVVDLLVPEAAPVRSARSHALTVNTAAMAAAINIDLCVLNMVVLLGEF